MSALLPLVLGWLAGSTPGPAAGPTLFPRPVTRGEELRVLVDGFRRAGPQGTAAEVGVVAVGDTVTALGETVEGRLRWVELSPEGWIEAARVDRPAEPISGNLEAGREGLSTGRVLPASYRPSDLVRLPDSLKAPGFEGKTLRMRREAAKQFAWMVAAARKAGAEIGAFSAHRPAAYQHRLYRRAVHANPAQTHVAAPGRSEHQLGTTVDVATPQAPPADASLERTEAGRWIRDHVEEFGFVVSFSRERHETRGVAFEPWHLRWVGGHVDDESGW